MGLSSAGESLVLGTLMTGRYISLHTADPGDTGVNEVTGGAYARQPATMTATGNNPTVYSNSALVEFPEATAGWGTISHFGIWSAATGGTYLGGSSMSVAKAVLAADVVRIKTGDLTISAD